MCILFISRKKNSSWPLLIATNRDEFYNREFDAPGVHWKGYPAIYAGKDKTGGGSWLGINKFGLCVAILNRNTKIEDKNFESIGKLINSVSEKIKYEKKNFKNLGKKQSKTKDQMCAYLEYLLRYRDNKKYKNLKWFYRTNEKIA